MDLIACFILLNRYAWMFDHLNDYIPAVVDIMHLLHNLCKQIVDAFFAPKTPTYLETELVCAVF